MNTGFPYILLVLILSVSCRSGRDIDKKNSHTLRTVPWEQHNIDPSITWKHYQFNNLFDTLENINVVDIDLRAGALRPAIVFQPKELLLTHEMAERVNALVAVNGNFFHTSEGGAVCFLKVDGKIIDTSRTDLTEKLFLDELDDAAFTIDSNGRPSIRLCPKAGWKSLSDVPSILSGGPALLIDNKPVTLLPHAFNDRRYARTGVGLTADHHLLLVTVDGHSPLSRGVTINEFRTIFRFLGCLDAMNLDGGGSTTLWIKGQPFNGVVNYPTDNKQYDHTGERKIANSLCIVQQ